MDAARLEWRCVLSAIATIARRFGHIEQLPEAAEEGVEVERTATVHGWISGG
ncbi:hypothetical protein [Cupriavidus pauculus]|uniref:hypothetical protein n=1 Tax=Cupriavidus pauculus TaxID=82633 RepID=UPI001EE30297|nr:hypothetical protein [Cupriavidus pauculus]GJG95512.1 hypothetical protein CBA19C6_13505 [Cupriavidus pauculus]